LPALRKRAGIFYALRFKKSRICNRACSLAAFTGMKKTFFMVLRKIHV
jgi:hypothetical protein